MNDYVSNSNKMKKEQAEKAALEKKVRPKKVVKGGVKLKKRNKLFGAIISEDARNVKSHSLTEIIIPAIKKMLLDVICDGASMTLFGEKVNRTRPGVDKVSYRQFFDAKSAPKPNTTSRSIGVYDYDKIVLDSRTDAEAVLAQLDDLIEAYGKATVADLYDSLGQTHEYTDNNYGWYNLTEARVAPAMGGGFALRLPPVEVIER